MVVTRSSNNFGPYQFPEKVIPLFVTNLIEGKKVPLYGDGMNVRDWCYVEDNCTGVDLVLRKGNVGEIYNIGAGNEVTNRFLTESILEILGQDESMIDYVEDRLGHDRRYSIDISKARALGWAPEREFREALETTVAWYRDNAVVVGAAQAAGLAPGCRREGAARPGRRRRPRRSRPDGGVPRAPRRDRPPRGRARDRAGRQRVTSIR